MTSETLNGIENFTSNLAFNNQNPNDFEDINNSQHDFDSILKNPVILQALHEANYDNVNDSMPDFTRNETDEVNNELNEIEITRNISENSSNVVYPPIEKLRIVIPTNSSPTSMHSSSSECSSPVRLKKNKKRFCIKCDIRFKHTVDWLKHLEKHVSLPMVKLLKLNEDDEKYKDYLERGTKRRHSTDSESLKIKLKIPRVEEPNKVEASEPNSNEEPESLRKTPTPPTNECRIRVLRADEIKQSPPRLPIRNDLPENAMVAVHSENRIHYECPILDGLNHFAEAMNEESTAQILKNLLETPNEPLETSEWDSTTNEFISIDRLSHTCKTCNDKYPDLGFLHEHQRLTGHADVSPASILEPIQEMTVDSLHQYHPPHSDATIPPGHNGTTRLEHLLQSRSKDPPPPQMPMYGQPPVLPIHQMENQVRNFGNMIRMQNCQRFPMPSRQPPPGYPVHQFMPSSQMMRSNGMQANNQPINMAPFLEMNPDMYNPRQAMNNIVGNGNVFNRPPNQMMNRFISPPPPRSTDQNLRTHFPMQHQRPMMNGPPTSRPQRNLPPYPMRPNMIRPPQIMPGQRQPIPNQQQPLSSLRQPMPLSPIEQQQQQQQQQLQQLQQQQQNHHQQQQQMQKARLEQMARAREIENRPIISNAPRTEGLPVIESVQSGAITLNATKKSHDTAPTTIQINDQITLSVKNKDRKPAKLNDTRKTPPAQDSNTVANILANRGITVKPTSKLIEKITKAHDDVNKTPYATAEAAVQKLQMNNSVSIISKKKPASATTTATTEETIDLSNDDDTSEVVKMAAIKQPKTGPSFLKCPMKTCATRFTNMKTLREHESKVHQINRLNKFKCTICSLRFGSSEAVRMHIKKMHANQMNKQPDFGIPVLNFNDPKIRKRMISLGFTNFLPINNIRNEKSELFGMPIININGQSINNLKNLFENDSTKIMPISSMRTIPRPKVSATVTRKPSPPSNNPNGTTHPTDPPSTSQT